MTSPRRPAASLCPSSRSLPLGFSLHPHDALCDDYMGDGHLQLLLLETVEMADTDKADIAEEVADQSAVRSCIVLWLLVHLGC